MFNESDESVIQRWIENPYWQYFCGEIYFQDEAPFDSTSFVHFRDRIGEDGFEFLLQHSIEEEQRNKNIKTVAIDPTVQPKNITYPTDSKLHDKIIKQCWAIAHQHQIKWRQSYKRKIKEWKLQLRFKHHKSKAKIARRAARLIKNKAKVLIRELQRKMPHQQLEQYQELFQLFSQVLHQKQQDKNKIYSLHEPLVYCINKGKVFPKYEFGTKASVAWDIQSGFVVGIVNGHNQYDGKLIEPTLEQIYRVTGQYPDEALVDRGCKGKKKIGPTQIIRPSRSDKKQSPYQKSKMRKKMRKRAGIEPIISHLKHDHRMLRCFLKGVRGDQNNMLLAAIGFNLRRRLNAIKKVMKNKFFLFFYLQMDTTINFILLIIKQSDKYKPRKALI